MRVVAKVADSSLAARVHVSLLEDERGRLGVWSGSIGAHLSGQVSLDFRLREASHIHQNIVELLGDLRQILCEVKGVLEDSAFYGDAEAFESSNGGEVGETEVKQLHSEVTTIIGCLYQMLTLVRQPARHSLLTEPQPIEVSEFERFDCNHVKEKFPKVDEILIRRLGHASTRRRKNLTY